MGLALVRLQSQPRITASGYTCSTISIRSHTSYTSQQLSVGFPHPNALQPCEPVHPDKPPRPASGPTSGDSPHTSSTAPSRQYRARRSTRHREGRTIQTFNVRARTRLWLCNAGAAFPDLNLPQVSIESPIQLNSRLIVFSSHFNTAHFMNPDFQPEEWSPDGEYATGNKGRHKSHSS